MGVFHLAIGIAALTPWGRGLYGSPIPWLKSAALLFSIAAITAGLGRAAAGNAGGASGGQSQQEQNAAFTDPNNPANQFSSRSASTGFVGGTSSEQRLINAVIKLADVIDRIETMPPDKVVMMGARGAARTLAKEQARALESSGSLVERHGRALNLE